MKKKSSYHTSIKTCYALGLENILPDTLRESIPRSTSHYWKSERESKYIGHEFANRISKNFDQANIILNDRVRHERALFVAFCRIKLTIINLVGKNEFKKLLQSHKPQVVSMVEKVKSIFGTKTICKFLNIEPKTYSVWKVKSNIFCPISKINLCFKKVSHQITTSEVAVLISFMTDPKYYHWPTASVWAYAIRSKEAIMSRASWYKYTALLDLKRHKVSRRYKPKKKGLKADIANQIWHADVSVYTTLDHVKYYIYTVVDNYSRMILAWDINTKLSGQIRLRSIQRAISEQFNINPSGKSIDLIVDGGSENNNGVIHEFIQNNQVSINKKIALKDIIQSNSLVEATYKIMKYKYFFKRQIVSTAMNNEMEFFVNDYNNVRPHYSHHYLTPFEVHHNLNPLNYKKIIKQAIKDRVVSNREQICNIHC
jgi:hypothetical protein